MSALVSDRAVLQCLILPSGPLRSRESGFQGLLEEIIVAAQWGG